MKITLSNLLLLINQKADNMSVLYSDVLKNSTIIKDRELNGTETPLGDVKDFDEVLKEYKTASDELVLYKNTLAKMNATIEVENGLTIIEAINLLSVLRNRLDLFESLSNKQPSLNRRFDGNGSNAYYRVTDLNFDAETIKAEKQELVDEIARLETLIQEKNATTFVEV